ncbi:MAG: pilus assembly protein, partial [Bdellovibrionales bacterium]|nr:pilus assembly protein [Bdellovibrionales bacterium]
MNPPVVTKKRTLAHSTTNSSERGNAMLEFTIVFPVCFILFLAVVDLCGWLRTQLLISRVAYEGAR